MEYPKKVRAETIRRMLEEAFETLRELHERRPEFAFIGKKVDFELGVLNNKLGLELLEEIKEIALTKVNSYKRNCLSKARFSALVRYLDHVPFWYENPEKYEDYENQCSPYKYDGYFWTYENYFEYEIEKLG